VARDRALLSEATCLTRATAIATKEKSGKGRRELVLARAAKMSL